MSKEKGSKIIEEVEEKVEVKKGELIVKTSIEDDLFDLKEYQEKVLEFLKAQKISVQSAQEMCEALLTGRSLEIKEKDSKDLKLFKQATTKFQKELELNLIDWKKAADSVLVFADPTYDATFKMLFANNEHKDVLISFLNNLLGFTGDNAIESLALDIIDPYLGTEYVSSIQSTIDVRCRTVSGKDISIEMQRKNKDYFLSRTQDYMAKLLATQVKEGEGEKYHVKLYDTYILVLAKQNLFVGEYKLEGDSNAKYEKTFKPTCEELGYQEMPGNKMHWKFYELCKFKTFTKGKVIDGSYAVKEQWLDFLVNCSSNLFIPENLDNKIKEGYKIMKMANWNRDQIVSYYKLKANEYDEQITIENTIKETEQKAFQEGLEKGLKKGKWEERLTSDIDKIKTGIKFNVKPEELTLNFNFKCLNKKRFLEKDWSEEQLSKKVKYDHPESSKDIRKEFLKFLDIFEYVKDHQSEKSDVICSDLKLLEDLEVIGYSSDSEEYN
jgi:predicted transposase/invertase (TIGR01784 family)